MAYAIGQLLEPNVKVGNIGHSLNWRKDDWISPNLNHEYYDQRIKQSYNVGKAFKISLEYM